MWMPTLASNVMVNMSTFTKMDIVNQAGVWRVRGHIGVDTHSLVEFKTEAEAQFWMHATVLQLGLVQPTRGGLEPG